MELTEQQMEKVLGLLRRHLKEGGSNAFKIYPPQQVLDQPAVLSDDQALSKLADTEWHLEFKDGHADTLSAAELVALGLNILEVKARLAAINQGLQDKPDMKLSEVNLKVEVNFEKMFAPETVKNVLGKLDLEDHAM